MSLIHLIRDCYSYRTLIGSLVQRQLAARYRGSVLGFLWTFLNPLLLILIYCLVFTVFVRFEMKNYGAFVFAGLLPWIWWSTSLLEGANSILASGHLITKAMFPPEVLPAVSLLATTVNFLLSLPILLATLLFLHVPLTLALLALPFVIAVQFILSAGLIFLFSALNVQFRDLQHLLANALSLLFFVTPVLYPHTNVPERYRILTQLNPMATIVRAYQDIFYHGTFPSGGALLLVLLLGIGLLFFGAWRFRSDREMLAEWL